MKRTIQPCGSDDTWQFGDAFRRLNDLDTLEVQSGIYQVTEPLVCLDKRIIIQADGAYLYCSGFSGPALTVGFTAGSGLAGGNKGLGWTLRGLSFHFAGGGGTYMNNNMTALTIQNVYGGRFHGINIDGFNVGVAISGNGVGCTESEINCQNMQNNQTHSTLAASNGGYVSEWTFAGGNWGWGPIGSGKAGVCIATSSGTVSSCRWNDVTFQGWPDVAWANISNCKYMSWVNCRYETTNDSVVTITLPTTTYNCSLIGNTNQGVSFTDLSGGANGHVFLPNWH